MSRINGDTPSPRIPTRTDKMRVPLWMLLLAVAGKGLWLGLRWCFRHRVLVTVSVGLLLFVHRFGPVGLAALAGGLVLAVIVWARLHPRSCSWVGRWLWGRARLAFVYRWRWRAAMVHTDLAIRMPTATGDQVRFDEYFPRIRTIHSTRAVDVLRVELLPGQTPELWAEQAEALRHIFRARRCQVHAETFRFVRLHFHHRDPLARPVPPAALDGEDAGPVDVDPDPADVDPDRAPIHPGYARLVAGLSAVGVGRREDGSPWTLPVRGTHILIAGATGAGKGSVLWGPLRSLGDIESVRIGRARRIPSASLLAFVARLRGTSHGETAA